VIELAGNVIIEDNKILLLHKKKEEHWEVPGGKVKEEESPTETAIREAEEEIGVQTELKKPFYSGEFSKKDKLYLWHGYLAKIDQEAELKENNKFEELKWIGIEEIDEVELAPNLKMIEPALRRILSREE